MTKITLFSQIINKLEKNIFRNIVQKLQTDKYNKGIDSWTQLVSMLFLHFSGSNSLREISNGLKSATGNLNHMGIKKAPSKSSLSYINGHRSWELYQEYYYKMLAYLSAIAKFKQQKFRIKSKIYLFDATLISVCLSVFDWAHYRTSKGAIKLHTVLDFDSCLPTYVHMTDGKVHETTIAKQMNFRKGSVIVMDRAYIDFKMLFEWTQAGIFFVTRLKSNIKFNRLEEMPLPEDRHTNILVDEYIELTGENSKSDYRKKLRRVVVYNEEKKYVIEILTNNFTWTANTISELYKSRWMIEIFFKEVKQLLKIKSFVGTTFNAVLIQIWTAMITMLILKFLKYIAKYNWCLSNLVAFLRLNLFVKIELQLWLDNPFEVEDTPMNFYKQESLFHNVGG